MEREGVSERERVSLFLDPSLPLSGSLFSTVCHSVCHCMRLRACARASVHGSVRMQVRIELCPGQHRALSIAAPEIWNRQMQHVLNPRHPKPSPSLQGGTGSY